MRTFFAGFPSLPHAFVACLVALCAGAPAQILPPPAIQQAGYSTRSVGCVVKCLETDSVLISLNADTAYIPASVAKTVTAAAAFDMLGQAYLFRTKLWLDGPFAVDSGVVRGSVMIRGSADPGFVAERVWLFAQQLLNRGIRRIEGDIILDDTYFDSVTVGPGFGEDRSVRSYEAPVGALSANFSSIEVHATPGSTPGSAVMVRVFPPQKGLVLSSSARTVGPGESGRALDVRTEPRGGASAVVVEGTMAALAEPKVTYRKMWETTANFGRVFAQLLQESGVTVTGTVRLARVPDSLTATAPFLVFESLPMRTYIEYLFKYSNNIAAEILFRTLGAERAGSSTWDSAAAVERRWWRECGLPGELRLENGSGMGGRNRLSPAQVVALLRYVSERTEYFPDYLAALSTAGVDGTLSDRFVRSRLKGKVRAKTGTLNNYGTSSLAGYAFWGGRTYVFAILVNDTKHGQYDHWMLQERILDQVLPQ